MVVNLFLMDVKIIHFTMRNVIHVYKANINGWVHVTNVTTKRMECVILSKKKMKKKMEMVKQ